MRVFKECHKNITTYSFEWCGEDTIICVILMRTGIYLSNRYYITQFILTFDINVANYIICMYIANELLNVFEFE